MLLLYYLLFTFVFNPGPVTLQSGAAGHFLLHETCLYQCSGSVLKGQISFITKTVLILPTKLLLVPPQMVFTSSNIQTHT